MPAKKITKKAPNRALKKKVKKMATATRPVSERLIATVADQLLTLKEVSELTGSSTSYLRWLCNYRAEQVPFARKIGRNWMMPHSRLRDIPNEGKGITGRPPGSGAGRKKAAGGKKTGRR